MNKSRRDFLREAGCAAISTAALAATVNRLGLITSLAQSGGNYRALVCIFLNGGNDGNNMVIPYDNYNAPGGYGAVRTAAGLAISQASLLQISPISQSGVKYGFHPNMVDMQTLFNAGKLAVLCNVGTLLQPTTKTQYQQNPGGAFRPYQLFSHSDQVTQQEASISNNPSQTGWGGRICDAMKSVNGNAPLPMGISIAGTSLFITGFVTSQLAIADSNTSLANVLNLNMSNTASGGSTALNARKTAYDQIRTFDNNFVLVKKSSDSVSQALTADAALSAQSVTINTVFPNTSIGRQLLQVARLIALRTNLGLSRQIFFVQLGGFDTHTNQVAANNSQNTLLAQLSPAMKAFYDATVELNVADSVTSFTLSDFGRTLQPAGSGAGVGTDHAWGNHSLIMGGAVKGGDFYGKFPALSLNSSDDADSGSSARGRWIPTTSIDQYAATLATWYGLPSNQLATVFPYLNKFPTSNLGFLM
jgi:uncharacterized protein (DUF1501 family)